MMNNDELLEQMNRSKIVMMDVDKLVPYARNAKLHTDEQVDELVALMREVGYTQPILMDGGFEIIAGHGRLLALKKMGMKKAPCIPLPHLSEAQKKAYRLADNQQVMKTGWDMDLLKIELNDLNGLNFDIGMIGFDDDFLNGILTTEPQQDKRELNGDPDEIPESAPSRVSRGDIWQLGDHRLMCGDSTLSSDMDRLMNNQTAVMWLTDPPYNVAYEGKTKDKLTIDNDSMDDGKFFEFLVAAYRNADRVLAPGGVFYIWHADSEGFNFRGAARHVGWKVRQCLVWAKSVLVMGRQDYHWKHEPCLYGWKEGAAHIWTSDRKQTTVLEFDKPGRNAEHPTMKPVALFEYQMGNNTTPGQIVLDSFGGSGTTLVAAEKLGRSAYLMEIDTKYCDVILARWEKLTGKVAVKIS